MVTLDDLSGPYVDGQIDYHAPGYEIKISLGVDKQLYQCYHLFGIPFLVALGYSDNLALFVDQEFHRV